MENSSYKKICRFCLETSNSNFETIEEVTFANLDFLWLKVNLSISEQPVMCGDCAKTIKTSLDFKTKCLEIENCIMACVKDKGRMKIDLRKVYMNKTPMENIVNLSEEHIVCRLCLELVKNDSVIFLRNHTDVVQKLEQNFPELDLTCTDDSVICASCQVSLQCHFSFINTCLTAEEKIMEYCKVEGMNSIGQIDLNSVIHFTPKGFLKCKFEAEAVKIEGISNEVSEQTSYSIQMKKEEILDVELDIKEASSGQESELTDKNSQQQDTLIHMDESKIEMHKCEACSFATKWKSTFQKHLLSHGDTPDVVTRGTAYKYKCHMCDFEAKWKANLKWHMLTHKTHVEITTYKCDLCDHEAKRKSDLKRHMLVHMDGPEIKMYKCELCPFKTKWYGSFQNHQCIHRNAADVVTAGTIRKCDLCDFEAKRKSDLKRHMLIHKTHSEITMYKCDLCDHETKRKFDLKGHMLIHKTHSEITTYKCYLCDHETKRKSDLKEHMLVHMNVPEIEMHKCELCPFKTKWYGSFRNHLHIHRNAAGVVTAGTIRKCDLCDFETKWKASLRKHMLIHKTHSEITTYKCDLCSYEAKLKYYLKGHMLTHKTASEITMYKCHQCKYETKRKFDLKKHTRTHKSHTRLNIRTICKDTCL